MNQRSVWILKTAYHIASSCILESSKLLHELKQTPSRDIYIKIRVKTGGCIEREREIWRREDKEEKLENGFGSELK